jgi:branched-chain amino acid transport system permease protein
VTGSISFLSGTPILVFRFAKNKKMAFYIQLIANSLMSGLVYALVASGLTLVMGITRIINFAHGEFYMLGAYGVFVFCTVLGINYFVALAITIFVVGALGWITERFLYRPVVGSFTRIAAVSIGLMLFLPSFVQLIFGEQDRIIPTVINGSVTLYGATMPLERLIVIGISLTIWIILWYIVQHMKVGLALRAVAENPGGASLQGMHVDNTRSLSMFIGCALAAIAGGMLAPVFFVSPFLGAPVLFKAFIIVILGGIGTITGAFVAGLLLGFIDVAAYAFLGGWTELISFTVVLVILVVKPSGLFGKAL